MKHFGDITALTGYELPAVDVVVGGSPCQDLSIAGKRTGLTGERSGLFMEQMRIVKEMRERDVRCNGRSGFLVRPRYMVWENVPGAFSSGDPKGSDFAAVLEEIIKVCEPDASVCVCVPQGGWTKSGCYYSADGRWSIAWRVHDAQFWGVPQRRKRIALVADFGGLSAPEILFERQGLRGDPTESREERKGTASPFERSPTQAISFQERAGKPGGGKGILIQDEHVGALSTLNNQSVFSIDEKMGQTYIGNDIGNTLGARDYKQPQAVVYENHSQDSRIKKLEDVSESVSAKYGTGGNNQPIVCAVGNGQLSQARLQGKVGALNCMHDLQAVLVFDKEMYNAGANGQGNPIARFDDCSPTVRADAHPSGICVSSVRRLTPLECERLQGMPDDWSRYGINAKGEVYELPDSARYKLQGNGIATPFWKYFLKRISAQYERTPTMGSLFDGQGSFPMIWEDINGKGTCLWSSEIEKHAIAVCKYHFPEDQP